MRKWIVGIGISIAFVAAVLLVRGGRREPAGGAPPTATAAPPSEASAPHPGMPAPHGPATDHGAQDPRDAAQEAMRAIVAYPVTMPRLLAYAAAVKEIRAAGEKDPEFMARLRAPKPPRDQQVELAAWLEAIPPLKTILDRHGIRGIDLVLMPQAVLQGRIAHANQNGQGMHPTGPDATNATAVALYDADPDKMEAITTAFVADLRALNGN